jgi:thiamine pyrophosphate-dependent acetolactate synthase large subunit-like protein
MQVVTTLPELPAEGVSGRIIVLAGPGVIDDDAIDGLRALAAAGDLGVANTWGAKGVFAWDSPHHLGTCGLQARDFELLGFGAADLIVATGVSSPESPRERFALAPVVEIAPTALRDAAGRVRATSAPQNDLYPRLAAVAQPGYADDKVPLHPARAAADLGAVLPAGGLVVAEPGVAGLWVARTFPTPALAPGEARRVVVPARYTPGGAATLAVEGARAGRPTILVVERTPDTATRAVIEAAASEHLELTVAVWSDDAGSLAHVDEHQARLRDALATPGVVLIDLAVELGDTSLLIDAAGDVVAWGGLDVRDRGTSDRQR